MKRIFLLIAVTAAAMNAWSENYLRPGLVAEYFCKGQGDLEETVATYKVEGDTLVLDNEPAYKVLVQTLEMEAPQLAGIIKTENEKTWFLGKTDDGSEKWYLAYDFGIEPGQSITLDYEDLKNTGEFGASHMFITLGCESREASEEYNGMTVINLTEEIKGADETGTGYWIDGLGAPCGLTDNAICFTHWYGNRSSIRKATFDGQVLFDNSAGMHLMHEASPVIRGEAGSLSISGLQGNSLIVSDLEGRVIYQGKPSGSTLRIECVSGPVIVRVDGNATKVLIKN